MEICIKYNDEQDQFSEDLTLQMRLKKYIKRNFYPAYVISLLAPIYLVGGSIRDLMNAKVPKDLDFVVVGNEHKDWVLDVLRKFGIDYTFNRFGGFKIDYKGTKVDLWTTDDLFSSMQYNVDGLYYDLTQDRLISLTFGDFKENGLKEVNPNNNIPVGREEKLLRFERDFRKNFDCSTD